VPDNDDLQAALEALPDKILEQLSDVIREQAEMLSAAQKDALRSLEDTEPTHALEESCTVVPGENELEFIVEAGGPLTTKEVREGSGVSYDYAEAFEYGTSRQTARPFFWPTYEALKDTIEQNIQEAVDEALK
jgi:HK97 gp10 family phage protein